MKVRKNISMILSGILLLCWASVTMAQDGPIPKAGAASAAKGFRFRGGNMEQGKDAFARLNCIQCHTVSGVEVPKPKGKRRFDLKLAEEVLFVKRYEDMVVAITNPRHVVSERYRAILTDAEAQGEIEPFMPDFTDDMSVRQLMDIVAFLDDVYSKAQAASYGKPAEK
jgi:mono/diheme cytochrome c family protein